MNPIKAFILVVSIGLSHSALYSQIDSSRLQFFPLHKGDVCQYLYGSSQFGSLYYRNQVVTTIDTVLSNGLHYTRVDGTPKSGTRFYRIDSLFRVQEYDTYFYDSTTMLHEANVFRLNEKDSTVYSIGYNMVDQLGGRPYIFRYNGIFLLNEFGATREIMDFQAGFRKSKTDTAYNYHCLLMKGFGVYRIEYGENMWVQLTGAIINGQQFGQLHTDVNHDDVRPFTFALGQNYPNPFNPSTTITFTLPSRSIVSLKIFNLLGQEVSTVASEELAAGNYSRQWNASDMRSGVYFYRLQAGHYTETKRLVLLK